MDQHRSPTTNQELLAIEDLSVSLKTDQGWSDILHRVALTVNRSETVALVGESGSGKSVTALSVMRLLEPHITRTSGKIRFDGHDLLECTEEEMQRIRGNRIAMVFQEPMTSLNPVYTVGDQIMEVLMLHRKMNRETAREFAAHLLHLTGIENPSQRIKSFPHQLSGGQRQRAMIAMALACEPDLLIADEPTTALDVTIQAQILDLLARLQQEMSMAILLITHDLAMVEKRANRVVIMARGRVVEQGKTSHVLGAPRHPYTRKLLESVPKGNPPPAAQNAPVLLAVKNLRCTFAVKEGVLFEKKVSTIKAVDNVTFTLREGTTLGIVGESGSGKTTLGFALLRLVSARGEVLYQGKDLLTLSQRQIRPLRRDIQLVFQDPFSSLSPRLTVGEIVEEGLLVHRLGGNRAERRRLVEQTLVEVGLTPEMAERYPHEFSGGQRQRIAIARAVILKPRCIVLDEPTSALDMTIQAQIIDLLKDLQRRHKIAYLFISHDLRTVRSLANEVMVMQNGRVVESGPTARVFEHPRHPYTKRLMAAALFYQADSAA